MRKANFSLFQRMIVPDVPRMIVPDVPCSLVKEGRGKTVERLYREVRHSAIPGGSEEILMDFFARSALRTAAKIRARL